MVVSAQAGIQVNTRRMFNEAAAARSGPHDRHQQARRRQHPFRRPAREHSRNVRQGLRAVQRPDRRRAQFTGVVNVLNPPARPAGCPVDLAAASSQLVDAIVEGDEALMEKYLSEGEISTRRTGSRCPRRWRPARSSRSFARRPKKTKTSACPNLLDAIT